ncbi:hypothetical protein ERC79_00615 [Rhodococcus sp. ABRD24]|uniref:hypothetical protein n=1 Tax=Rhodococcus sp. ABRD24 TaxID=2507582 RepID=UPI00103DE5E7|nr:hypothetical protein [Rhodococcus sp. ABRD24]QBJ94636.1 hypothetical protein ERC79_00615 [Rhodococcus sp. ABRD24]
MTQWLSVIVLLVNGALFFSGVVTRRQALALLVAVEAPLLCIAALAVVGAIVAKRRAGAGMRQVVTETLADSPFGPMVKTEIRSYVALWMWIRGRNSVPESDAVVFSSHAGTLVVPTAFALATGIEVVVLHLLIPWQWVQAVLAVLSVWSLVMLFGYFAIHRTHPHYATSERLVLRHSGAVVVAVALANIERVTLRRRFAETTPAIVAGRLFLPNADGTTVDMVLGRPVTVRMPALSPSRRKTADVTSISVYVDEPDRLISRLRYAGRDAAVEPQ